jgi:Protein of unknown function (DUF3313)
MTKKRLEHFLHPKPASWFRSSFDRSFASVIPAKAGIHGCYGSRPLPGRRQTTQTDVLNFSIRTLVVLIIAGTLAACGQTGGGGMFQTGQIVGGGTKEITDVQPVAGFLPNASLLQPGGAGRIALVYRNPTANFGQYNKVLLDPVAIWTAPDSPLNDVPQSQRQAAANRFHADLYNALSKRCQMVTAPSPGTLRLRIALTDATTPNATVNTVATYTPYVSTGYGLASLAFNNGVGYFAGTATAEGYATDATTGTLLWEGVDKRGGTTAMAENTLNTWLDVDHSFDAWSQQLASRLQELGACRR